MRKHRSGGNSGRNGLEKAGRGSYEKGGATVMEWSAMQLTEEQKQRVREWIEEGLQPFEIQQRLEEEFGLHLTYMEVKLLLSELNLTPKDRVEEKQKSEPQAESESPAETKEGEGLGTVTVTIDEVTRPGAIVSGRVRFRDGKEAAWYLDQYGRLGLIPPEPGYRPSADEVTEFQRALEQELARRGY